MLRILKSDSTVYGVYVVIKFFSFLLSVVASVDIQTE